MGSYADGYAEGWATCRCYLGQPSDASPAFRRGFNDCLAAYHAALDGRMGWDAVPATPPPEAMRAAVREMDAAVAAALAGLKEQEVSRG